MGVLSHFLKFAVPAFDVVRSARAMCAKVVNIGLSPSTHCSVMQSVNGSVVL